MRKRIFSLLGIAVFVAMTLMPATSVAATATRATKPHTPHIMKAKGTHAGYPATLASTTTSASSSNNLVYNGGPVMAGVAQVYTIFWEPNGSTVSPNYNALINRYFGDVGSSSLYQMLSQYTVQGTYPSGAVLAGSWIDTVTPYPGAPGANGYPGTPLLDTNIQSEVAHAQAANSWPAGGPNDIFFVFTGQNEGLCFDNTETSCTPDVISSSNTSPFCAYHDFYPSTTPQGSVNTIYAAMPYAASPNFTNNRGTCSYFAGPNNDAADWTINVTSHEEIEAATDPLLNAWYDASGYEIGDKCAWTFAPSDAQGADVVWGTNSNRYLIQQEWDNALSGCVISNDNAPKYYQIVNRNSGLVMDVTGGGTTNGAQVIQWTNHTGANQQWQLVPDGAFYQIVNRNSGLVLDVFGGGTTVGANVIQWTNHNGTNQQWYLLPDGGYDVIVNNNSNLVMDVFGGGTNAGAHVIQWSFHNGTNQQWALVPVAPYYKIVNHNSNLVMDVYGGGTTAGAHVIQWSDHNGLNQQWALVPDGTVNGTPIYQIENLNSGLVMDVFGGGTTVGAQVIQWPNHNGTNQQWELLPNLSSCLNGSYCQIQNVNSGLVLDVFGGGTTMGVNVIQWTNHNGTNQQWTLIPTSE